MSVISKKLFEMYIKATIVDFTLSSRDQLRSEEIVAEMVTSFLLPEVERIYMRERGILCYIQLFAFLSFPFHCERVTISCLEI